MIIPNIWKNKKCSKPPTRNGFWPFHSLFFTIPEVIHSDHSNTAKRCLPLWPWKKKRVNLPMFPVVLWSFSMTTINDLHDGNMMMGRWWEWCVDVSCGSFRCQVVVEVPDVCVCVCCPSCGYCMQHQNLKNQCPAVDYCRPDGILSILLRDFLRFA